MDELKIVDKFTQYFQIIPVNGNSKLLSMAQQIRYQVYCEEFHYESAEQFPDQKEQDLFDQQSLHCLLMHVPTQKPVGCTRLIGAYSDKPVLPLPFEQFCPEPLLNLVPPLSLKSLPVNCYGEFSRLAVLAEFRRRQSDEKKPVSLPEQASLTAEADADERRDNYPLIPIALFTATLTLLLRSDYCYGFAMMEPRLVRLLKRFGIYFVQVGKLVDYHGPRAPFVIHRDQILPNLTSKTRALMDIIGTQLDTSAMTSAKS